MENMAAVLAPQPTEACDWFARQALLLNSLYRRVPLPGFDNVYKSRAAEMWIGHRGLGAAINQVNAQALPPPPALP